MVFGMRCCLRASQALQGRGDFLEVYRGNLSGIGRADEDKTDMVQTLVLNAPCEVSSFP